MSDIVIYEYTKHPLRNISIALLMSILCFLSAVIFSVISYHYYRFKPFKKLEEKIGAAYFSWDAKVNMYTTGAKGLGEQYSVSYTTVFDFQSPVSLYIYDEWIWKNWEPRIKRGKWLKEKNKSGLPEVVIGGNTKGYDVGDVINLRGYLSQEDTAEQEFKVIGILQDKTELMGGNTFSRGGEKYNKCFFETNNNEESPMYVIVKESDMAKSSISDIYRAQSLWRILDYRDDILTQEEIEQNNKIIDVRISHAGVPFGKFMDNSRKVFRAQIMLYIPLFVLALVLIGIVIFNVTRIDLRDSSYSHSIYYLLGADRKTCRHVSTYVLLINVLMSVIMFAGEFFLYAKIAETQNLNYRIGVDTFAIAGIVYIVLIAYSSLVSYLMSRGMTPVDMLRKNRTAI